MRPGWRSRQTGERGRIQRLAQRYRAFAVNGFRGECELYERLALTMANSPEILAFIAELPEEKQPQPALFLGAVRHLRGVPEDEQHLLAIFREESEAIRELMLTRRIQTNEPARCSVLLPLLAQLPQPLAIVEVGASAGLCLLPDLYGYDYGRVRLDAPAVVRDLAPIFVCETTGSVPLPLAHPRVVWRRGLDLDPIDVDSNEEVAWLETLVWPGQRDRARQLRAAIEVARVDPPPIVRGDLLTDLEPLLAQAPKDATLVVFHTGVLRFVAAQADRDRFAQQVMDAGAVWISNEAPWAYPRQAEAAPDPPVRGRSLLMLNGEPVAWAGSHGQFLDWFGA